MSQTISSTALAGQLKSSLGQTKAREVVSEVIVELGLDGAALSQRDCERILATLAQRAGLVGMVARFASARLPFLFNPVSVAARPPKPAPSAVEPRGDTFPQATVIRALATTLGHDHAARIVTRAAQTQGLHGRATLTADETRELLNGLAEEPGLVGRAARFAKNRLRVSRTQRMKIAQPSRQFVSASLIAEMLAESLSPERSRALVAEGAQAVGLNGGPYERDAALRLLDAIISMGGDTAIDAQLVKTRVRIHFMT